jgi:peptidoglycan/xylan/chitin deacetylase (PgdA/CDA1 family)
MRHELIQSPVLLVAVVAALSACHSTAEMRVRSNGYAAAPGPTRWQLDGVATWRGDATAAYSLVHDDICGKETLGVFSDAEPELAKRGLHAGFGVIVSACDAPLGGTWEQIRTLVAHGHDVFSHSWDHPCMTNQATLAEACDPKATHSVDFAKQIRQAAATLRAVTGLSQDFFIFPYDVCDPAAIAYLKESGYLAARCGTPGSNSPEFRDPFAIHFDVFGPDYSKYFGLGACAKTSKGTSPVQFQTPPAEYSDACRLYVLNHYVDDAILAKGWAVRELHGLDPVDSHGWETVPVADYRAHLDYVSSKIAAGELWVEGPTTVVKYRFARAACALPTVDRDRLRFPVPKGECQKYATVLSYRLTAVDGRDPAHLSVRQGERALPARRVAAGHFVVDADPSKGDALLIQ